MSQEIDRGLLPNIIVIRLVWFSNFSYMQKHIFLGLQLIEAKG